MIENVLSESTLLSSDLFLSISQPSENTMLRRMLLGSDGNHTTCLILPSWHFLFSRDEHHGPKRDVESYSIFPRQVCS
jgi:hypothetical protein